MAANSLIDSDHYLAPAMMAFGSVLCSALLAASPHLVRDLSMDYLRLLGRLSRLIE